MCMWERVVGSVTGNGMFVLCAASALFVAYFQACPRNTQLEAKCALISTLYNMCRGDFKKNIYLYFKVNVCKSLYNAALLHTLYYFRVKTRERKTNFTMSKVPITFIGVLMQNVIAD